MEIDFNTIRNNINIKAYRIIGWGTGRTVFDLENGYVVKAAKNRKGIEQSKAEYRISNMDQNNIFAQVIALSDDYKYLIMEKAQRINSFSVIWDYYKVRNNRQLFSLEVFNKLLPMYDLLPNDLYRLSSWGIVKERPVIVDYGFTRGVRKFYNIFGI
ncbi:MAG: hypothetical protein GX129_04950 [Clostridiales bacterium]|jgi:hydroxylamine reductase (hybrid-cluster protein)|nr:hypothetical protein [Clostridiales bacterium]